MFWFPGEPCEEEWSLSAKVIGGLVLNPFSIANACGNRLIDWFAERVTGQLIHPVTWGAKPEYAGDVGRNDWRLQFDSLSVAVECKFGDGIDPKEDCLKYLGDCNHVVVVASDEELSKLTADCADTQSDDVEGLVAAIEAGRVHLLAWCEIVDAACERLPAAASAVLADWASRAHRQGLQLAPRERLAGVEACRLIVAGERSAIPVKHVGKGWGPRVPTGELAGVCKGAPEWVLGFMLRLKGMCEGRAVFEEKRRGWVNVRLPGRNLSVTLVPYAGGLAVVVSHPPEDFPFPPQSKPVTELECYEQKRAMRRENWFPRARARGLEVTSQEEARGLESSLFKWIGLLR